MRYFQECTFCDNAVENLEEMKKSEITKELMGKIRLVEQLIKKYNSLCKKNEH